jgi:predicted tellurium resistance membrane protein TerC
VGGSVLFWVAWKLLRLGTESQHPEDRTSKAEETRNLRQAIILIVTADFMMSLDNVIAIAGSAHGSPFLIVAGLLISMPLLMGTGGAISVLIDRFTWLVPLGAGVICFTGSRMIFEDQFIESKLELPPLLILAISVAVGVALVPLFGWANRRRAGPDGQLAAEPVLSGGLDAE